MRTPDSRAADDGAFDQSGNQRVDQLAQGFLKLLALAGAGELSLNGFEDGRVLGHFAGDVGGGEQTGHEGVVEIGGVVGDFVGQIDELGFERRPLAGKVGVELGNFAGLEIARMLGNAFAHFEGQVQAGEAGVALLEFFDDAQGVNIVIEVGAEAGHLAVEFLLAGMGEGRMADVVRQRQGFGEIFVETQDRGHGAGNLGNLDGVGEAVAEMVGKAGREDLRLGFQPAESAGMNDAVAIALEGVAVGMIGFRIAASQAVLDLESKPGKHGVRYFWLRSPRACTAIWLTVLRVVRSGSSILRASSGRVLPMTRARAMVASSLETKMVGCSISERSNFSASGARPVTT